MVLVLAFALIIAYGNSEPIIELREHILSVWSGFDYEEALETLGRSFSLEEEKKNAIAVFGQEILGFTAE